MKDLIRLTDLHSSDVYEIFHIADEIGMGKYNDGYEFKKNLLVVQQAVMAWCMAHCQA